jgi:tol-pal system protein YbgF
MRSILVAAVVVACVPLPASAQNREHQQMALDMRMLQEQTQQLALALQQAMTQFNDSMKKLEARLDAAEQTSRKTAADQKVVMETLSGDLRIVRERTQDLNTRVGTLTEEVEAMRGSIAALAARTPAQGVELADGAAAPVDPAAPAPAAAGGPPRPGLSPQRLFDAARADYVQAQYSTAITGFQIFLNNFPDSLQADDALLYIGDSYQALNRLPEAAKAYNEIIQNHRKGDRLGEAYLQLGQTQRLLGNVEAARSAWQTVVDQFPGSTPAILAAQRLQGLAPPPAPAKP